MRTCELVMRSVLAWILPCFETFLMSSIYLFSGLLRFSSSL